MPSLPRFALRNRPCDFKGKSRKFLEEKFLGIRYGEIFFDNFAILIGVIRRMLFGADNDRREAVNPGVDELLQFHGVEPDVHPCAF